MAPGTELVTVEPGIAIVTLLAIAITIAITAPPGRYSSALPGSAIARSSATPGVVLVVTSYQSRDAGQPGFGGPCR
jgi:hypothetical protein